MLAIGSVDWEIVDAPNELIEVDEAGLESIASEFPVTVSAGGALRQDEIARLEAESHDSGLLADPRRDLDSDQAIAPPRRSPCGLRSHSVRVVAVGTVKGRAIAEARVDLLRLAGSWRG